MNGFRHGNERDNAHPDALNVQIELTNSIRNISKSNKVHYNR